MHNGGSEEHQSVSDWVEQSIANGEKDNKLSSLSKSLKTEKSIRQILHPLLRKTFPHEETSPRTERLKHY